MQPGGLHEELYGAANGRLVPGHADARAGTGRRRPPGRDAGRRRGFGGVKALWDEVGAAAAVAEVAQFGEVTRHPVEAPAGLYIVSAALEAPFTVRILDRDGRPLAEIEERAGWPDD
jgi:hypothetical protein